MRDCLVSYCRRYGFGDEDEKILCDLFDRIMADPETADEFIRSVKTLSGEDDQEKYGHGTVLPRIAERVGAHVYTVCLLYYIAACRRLFERYREMGISEKIYYDTVADIFYKYRECRKIYGFPGLFTGDWHARFFVPDRFCLGRLQFELNSYERDDGYRGLKRGDPVLGLHIPETGTSFAKDARFDSYKQAYEFFTERYPDKFPDGRMAICTESWLLFPEHRSFLKGCPNVMSFMDDFDVLEVTYSPDRGDLWRIFGTKSMNVDDYPTDTSMQRSYVDFLKRGGTPGYALGIFIMDGPGSFEK